VYIFQKDFGYFFFFPTKKQKNIINQPYHHLHGKFGSEFRREQRIYFKKISGTVPFVTKVIKNQPYHHLHGKFGSLFRRGQCMSLKFFLGTFCFCTKIFTN